MVVGATDRPHTHIPGQQQGNPHTIHQPRGNRRTDQKAIPHHLPLISHPPLCVLCMVWLGFWSFDQLRLYEPSAVVGALLVARPHCPTTSRLARRKVTSTQHTHTDTHGRGADPSCAALVSSVCRMLLSALSCVLMSMCFHSRCVLSVSLGVAYRTCCVSPSPTYQTPPPHTPHQGRSQTHNQTIRQGGQGETFTEIKAAHDFSLAPSVHDRFLLPLTT